MNLTYASNEKNQIKYCEWNMQFLLCFYFSIFGLIRFFWTPALPYTTSCRSPTRRKAPLKN